MLAKVCEVSRRRWRVLMLLTFLGFVIQTNAQSPLDGFEPSVNGSIYVVVVQPDGKILVGGNFTTISPNGGDAVMRNRIARLNSNGTLDAAFDPNANGNVETIAVQADGKILVGGAFTTIGGAIRNRVARVDAVTGVADTFDPDADGAVYSLALQANGKIVVGGAFTTVGGAARNHIGRLDPFSGLADTFSPNANNDVYVIAVQDDQRLLVGGVFSSIGGASRNRIARIDSVTGLSDGFNPNGTNGDVATIAVQADGKILVGGGFTGIGAAARNHLARLDPMTGLADSFDPNANAYVFSVVVQPDGKILAGGYFNSIGGVSRNRIARLDPATGLADSFAPNANVGVYAIAVQSDGKVLVGGDFNTFSPSGSPAVTRHGIARLERDGRVDQTLYSIFSAAPNNSVLATAVQADGKILIGGIFGTVSGVIRHSVARLNTDGTVDATFDPNASGFVYAFALQPDGKILVGGNFAAIGGQARRGVARLDPTTGLADSFNPNAGPGFAYSLAVQADGKILVGGEFTNIGGQPRNYIARLDPTTGLADSFNPHSDGSVYSIVLQPDDKLVVGGLFANIGGQSRSRLARLDGVTGLADSFDPNPTGSISAAVSAIAVQPDGKILVAGEQFGTVGGQPRVDIARLDPVSGLADLFDPHPMGGTSVRALALQADGQVLVGGYFNGIGGAPRQSFARLDGNIGMADSFQANLECVFCTPYLSSIVVQSDGKILVGGSFTNIAVQTRNSFARLANDAAALEDLYVAQDQIGWARAGSSPQFTHVTFEYSEDNMNFVTLGLGAPVGNSWMLTGLHLTTGVNLYIRARGYFGNGGTAESVTESVRNVFFPGATPTPAPTASPTPVPTATPKLTATPTPGPTGTPCNPAFSENFDGVTPPVFPAGWVPSNNGGDGVLWVTSNTAPDTAPNCAFIPDQDGISDKYLYTPAIVIGPASAVIRFRNHFETEASEGVFWDGGVLEVSTPNIAGGTFIDITNPAIGGSFISGGYTGTISSKASNPLSGRMAWSGSSGGYVDTVIDLGTSLSGQTITLRFRMGTDKAVAALGWAIDTFSVMDKSCLTPTPPPTPSPTPTATPLPTATPTPSSTPSPFPSSLGNISTRLRVETSDGAMIGGFIITGTQPKTVIVRGIGPSLNIPGALEDPVIAVYGSAGELVATNDNWKDATSRRQIVGAGLAPANDLECALWGVINPGAYTVVVQGKNDATGIGLFEVYELDHAVVSKLANISTRGVVQTGNEVMIAGVIVLGETLQRVIVRAIGPSLPVSGRLADPSLELRDGNGMLTRANDNWRSDQEAEIIATGIPPTDDLESAIVATLPADGAAYTAIVRGTGETTGIALIEMYGLTE